MKAGELRHRVQIQRPVEVGDGFGGAGQQQWKTLFTTYAAIQPGSACEFITVQQMAAEATTTIRIRYHAGITPKMRVLYGSRVFDIQGVLNVEERNREIHLICIERNV